MSCCVCLAYPDIIFDCLGSSYFIYPFVIWWAFWFLRTVVNMVLWLYLYGFLMDFIYLFYLVELLAHMVTLSNLFYNCDGFPKQPCGPTCSFTSRLSGFQCLHMYTEPAFPFPSDVSHGLLLPIVKTTESQLGLDGLSWVFSALTESFYIESRKMYFPFCLKPLAIEGGWG